MRKFYYAQFFFVAVLLSVMGLASCDEVSDNEDKQGENLLSVSEVLKDGMIKITKHIGDWDAAVLYAEDGYIMYKNEVIDDTRNMDYIQIQSPDADYDCAIFANSDNSLPELMNSSFSIMTVILSSAYPILLRMAWNKWTASPIPLPWIRAVRDRQPSHTRIVTTKCREPSNP